MFAAPEQCPVEDETWNAKDTIGLGCLTDRSDLGQSGRQERLESASVGGDIAPFSTFIAERVAWSMKEAAKKPAPR